MSPFSAFLTGLTVGGLSCLAVQGGLLLGLLARREEEGGRLSGWQRFILPTGAFLVAKIAAYTLLGFALGWIGEKVQLTSTARIVFQTIAGLFMIFTAIRLIVPHWLPWLTINPPASVRRFIRRSAKNEAIAAPAFLGFLMVLIPCGITQAMEVAAVASGSAWQGAAILFAFTLGTAPFFFLIGVLAKGTALFQKRLAYAAAAVVAFLGLYALNGVLVQIDSPYSFQNEVAAFRRVFWQGTTASVGSQAQAKANTNPVITVYPDGYQPNALTVPSGTPVRLTLRTSQNGGCTSVFRIPKLKIEKTLPVTGDTIVTATFPTPGKYTFSCGMGMFTGTVTAI